MERACYLLITAPLYKLLKKGKESVVGSEEEIALKNLEKNFEKSVVLAYPNFSQEFIVHSDASDGGIGAVISKVDKNRIERQVSFTRRRLTVIFQK